MKCCMFQYKFYKFQLSFNNRQVKYTRAVTGQSTPYLLIHTNDLY